MEMPISVIMILFVSIVVGVAMIGFSGITINKAEQEINELGTGRKNIDNSIVEVNTLTENQAKTLGEQCYRDKKGTLDRELCYVVKGKIGTIDGLNGEQVGTDEKWKYSVSLEDDANAVFIYYEPLKGEIEITT